MKCSLLVIGVLLCGACGGDASAFHRLNEGDGGGTSDASVDGPSSGGGPSKGGAGGVKGTGGRGAGGASGRGTGGNDFDGGQSGADAGPGDSDAGDGGGSGGHSAGGVAGRGAGGASGGAGGRGAGGTSSGGSGTGGSMGGAGGAPAVTYANCAAWKAAGIKVDGVRTVDPDATGPVKPFSVYCTGMTSTASPARDYLELPHNEDNGWPGRNVSTFAKVGNDNCSCTSSLTTHFTRVLMRTGDLTLLSADRTFGVFDSDPACWVSDTNCDGEKIGFGNAEDCRGIGAAGTANIDLGGTVFHISSAAVFAEHGYLGNGMATVTTDRKQANVTGGGYCGGYGPASGELTLEQD